MMKSVTNWALKQMRMATILKLALKNTPSWPKRVTKKTTAIMIMPVKNSTKNIARTTMTVNG